MAHDFDWLSIIRSLMYETSTHDLRRTFVLIHINEIHSSQIKLVVEKLNYSKLKMFSHPLWSNDKDSMIKNK